MRRRWFGVGSMSLFGVVALVVFTGGCGGTASSEGPALEDAGAALAEDAGAGLDAGAAEEDGGAGLATADAGAPEVRDAGAPDAGALDAGAPDAGTAGPCGPNPLICLDFEDGEVGPGVSVETSRGGQGRVSDARAVSGRRAFHARVPGTGGAKAVLVTRRPFPTPDNHHFGRAYFYFERPTNDGHTHVLRVSGPDPLSNGTAAYRLDGVGYTSDRGITRFNGRFESRRSFNEKHGGVRSGIVPTPMEAWICVEWEFDGSNDVMRYWLNEAPQPRLDVEQRADGLDWVAPDPFRELEIGLRQYDPNRGQRSDVYVDAVVISTERVGCL